jgi:hypothetical protein
MINAARAAAGLAPVAADGTATEEALHAVSE